MPLGCELPFGVYSALVEVGVYFKKVARSGISVYQRRGIRIGSRVASAGKPHWMRGCGEGLSCTINYGGSFF